MIVPIQKTARKYESIYEQMITMIEDGVWEAGERIPGEETLAAKFGVSRNSLRTAIKVLHTSEILELKPGVGTFVSHDAIRKIKNNQLLSRLQDDHSFDDILDVRFIIEKETTFLAAMRRTPEELRALEDILERLKAAVANKEQAVAVEIGSQFHLQIIRMTHNQILVDFYESLRYSVNEEKKSFLAEDDANFQKVYDFYIKRDEALIQAIRDGDGELARTLVEEHISSKKDITKRSY